LKVRFPRKLGGVLEDQRRGDLTICTFRKEYYARTTVVDYSTLQIENERAHTYHIRGVLELRGEEVAIYL